MWKFNSPQTEEKSTLIKRGQTEFGNKYNS